MIQPAVLRRFADTFASRGFDARAFLPSYGMAEVCVGLSFGRRFAGFRTDRFGPREFVVCGQAIDGHRLQIRGESGLPLGERHVGRIFAKGPSIMPGYFLKTEESLKVLDDHGWLNTGDLGYWCAGELVVTGRAKDLIIANGRNIWPQDIEWVIEALPRLRRGDACAFSVDSGAGEEVVVLVQGVPAQSPEVESLIGSIRQTVKETAGVDCRIQLVSRQVGLPLTSSGKLSRALAKARFVTGGYADAVGRFHV
jgi:fatty-acyl-CoA synthase